MPSDRRCLCTVEPKLWAYDGYDHNGCSRPWESSWRQAPPCITKEHWGSYVCVSVVKCGVAKGCLALVRQWLMLQWVALLVTWFRWVSAGMLAAWW